MTEGDWVLADVTNAFHLALFGAQVLSVDGDSDSMSQGMVGIEISSNGLHEILLVAAASGEVVQRIEGTYPTFDFFKGTVGFIKIDRKSVKDAFFLQKYIYNQEDLVVVGGFYEQYPAVSSVDCVYIFRSSVRRTLALNKVTNAIDNPQFLINRIVLAVSLSQDQILVDDIATRRTEILSMDGKIKTTIKTEEGEQALEFSRDSKYVFLSSVRVIQETEQRDLVAYDVASGARTVIRRNFTVGLGQISRMDPRR